MKTRNASTVQDGHTLAQQTIYSAMWNHPQDAVDGPRKFTGGYGRLAFFSGMNRSTIVRNIPVLIRNLSIEMILAPDCSQQRGTTYLVYDFKSILRRRKEAGLVVIASRGKFVTAPSLPEAHCDGKGTPATVVTRGTPSARDVDGAPSAAELEEFGLQLNSLVEQLSAPLGPPNKKTLMNLLTAARAFDAEATPTSVVWFICYCLRENLHRFESWGLVVLVVREEYGRRYFRNRY